MTIAVVGVGFVGLVTAAVFSKFGNTVWAVNRDKQKSEELKKGKVPFFEPGLEELVKENVDAGRLKFTVEYPEAIREADVIMIAVGTPSAPDGTADLSAVFEAAQSLAPHIKTGAIIIVKSTVPPGTNNKVKEIIKIYTKKQFYTASVPEFLREGTAVEDTLHPDRILIGANEPFVIKKLLELHRPLNGETVIMRPESAQLTKYSANAYLANRIVFINQISDLAEKTGADVQEIIRGMGLDRRIGLHYWWPGLGYGGSCYPKDIKELTAYARRVGEGDGLFEKIDQLNENRLLKMLSKFEKAVGGWNGKTIAVLGLSFKPNTDDMREAPSMKVIPVLTAAGAAVSVYDPQASGHAKKILGDSVATYAANPYEAVKGATALIILVEWDEFRSLDLAKIKKNMTTDAVFIDTRNLYDPQRIKEAGLKYVGIGR
ncbi:UDP-glucose/GDP-mannose dehydrogenase family protein [Candidatus Collierbacteria bacterium]|nr:UDP-glucose/GDP-mannose dehydrogenase family protein [Candidatus Collierbacteria bacterium]